MANFPAFPESVEVASTDLQLETNQRIAEDNERLIDIATPGVASGLAITINGSDNKLFDIDTGHGYCPNGQLITNTAPILGHALSDPTLNVVNYVTLMYTEAGSAPRAIESTGNRANTVETGIFRVVVLSATAFAALTATSSNLAINAKDRALVIGTILSKGSGNPLLISGIVSANRALADSNPITVRMPSPATVTGVEAVGTNYGSTGLPPTLGAGTLTLDNSTPTAPTLAWQCNGDTIGSPVNVAAGGYFDLTAGGPSLSVLRVFVSPELFPVPSVTAYTDTVILDQNLYPIEISPELSAIDRRHRKTFGDAAPNTSNVHGTRGSDISPVLRVQQGIILGDGLAADVAHSTIPRMYAVATVGADYSLMAEWAGAVVGITHRIYVDGVGNKFETTNAYWDAANTNWRKDTEGFGATLERQTDLLHEIDTRAPSAGSPWVTGAWERASIETRTGTTVQKVFDISGDNMDASDAVSSGYLQSMLSATTARWQLSAIIDAITNIGYRRYAVISGGKLFEEETINARWDGTNWNRDVSSDGAMKHSRTPATGDINYWFDATATAAWVDANWIFATQVDGQNGNITATGLVTAGTPGFFAPTNTGTPAVNTTYGNSMVKAWAQILFPGDGTFSYLGSFNCGASLLIHNPCNIRFTTPLTNGNYAVAINPVTPFRNVAGVPDWIGGNTGAFVGVVGDALDPGPSGMLLWYADNKSAIGFDLNVVVIGNGGVSNSFVNTSRLNLASSDFDSIRCDFVVYGTQ